jgi:hypothetical protein
MMGGQFLAQLAAIIVRIRIRGTQRASHGIQGARRWPKGTFVGIQFDES